MSSQQQFCDITGVDPNTASQYLEMTNGDLQRAIDLFFSGAAPSKPRAPGPSQPGPQRGQPAPRPVRPPQKSANDMIKDIFDNASKQAPPAPDDPSNENAEKHKITFYKNGFTVDDGEFRDNNDPANAEFLAAVERGQVPRELMNKHQAVDVEIDDQREKDYKKPKPVYKPFSGQAHTLAGSGSAPKQPAKPAPAAAPAQPAKTNYATNGQPSTKVRIQCPDGQVLTLTVNQSATIADLKSYIHENRPQLSQQTMKLKCTFPPKELTNPSATILDEGLKMATIQVL